MAKKDLINSSPTPEPATTAFLIITQEAIKMDQSKIIEILLKGADAWNKWREGSPLKTLDLKGTNLRAAALNGANLRAADFRAADLNGANLSKANLIRAALNGANLFNADLRGANLRGANLSKAVLFTADLSSANFLGANLREAKTLTIDQLCQTKILFQAELDPDLLKQVKQKCPRLLKEPKDEEAVGSR